MKNYLFLDSTHFVQVGVVTDEYEWRHVEVTENKKGSAVIHKLIFDVLELTGLTLKQIDGLFLVSGPGSYTGIRLGEGIAQILEMENIPVYSFYHYEVPHFCGYESYTFFANAFKNEYFSYQFNLGTESKTMISKESFLKADFSRNDFYCITGELEEMYLESTSSLIQKKPKEVFEKVLSRGEHCAPYYYRPLEKEFKPSFKQ